MKTLKNLFLIGGLAGLSLLNSGCGNNREKSNTEIELRNAEIKLKDAESNAKIELYNQLLESYMAAEDLNFQKIVAHYKENVTELKECRDNKTLKEDFNGLEYNRGVYEIELKYIKEYSEIREAHKKEILNISKKIKKI